MIPILLFTVLVIMDFALILYAIIDNKNRLYANVVMAFVAAILSSYLGVVISSTIVYDEIGGAVNVITSPSAGNFFGLVSYLMFVYTVIMAYDVIDEAFEDKKAKAIQSQEEQE